MFFLLMFCIFFHCFLALLLIKKGKARRRKTHSKLPFAEVYFNQFNHVDLKVRSCKNISYCLNRFESSLRLPTKLERAFLKRLTQQANQLITQSRCFKLNHISWKFCIFGKENENGFPHTHMDYIFLPENFSEMTTLLKTLIHEKIHIYQRLCPFDIMNLYTKYWNLKVRGLKKTFCSQALCRSNPDNNDLIFEDVTSSLIIPYYKHNAKTLSDITDKRDHPNEMLAYMLTDLICGKELNLKNWYHRQLLKWIVETNFMFV